MTIDSQPPFPKRDLDTSDEDYDDLDEFAEDDRSIIGVSIGRAQTRLLDPTLPAAEKNAALYDGATSSAIFSSDEPFDKHRPPIDVPVLGTSTSSIDSTSALPSPWQAGANHDWSISQVTSRTNDQGINRGRTATSSHIQGSDNGIRRFVESFGSLPKIATAPRQSISNAISWLNNSELLSHKQSDAPLCGPEDTESTPFDSFNQTQSSQQTSVSGFNQSDGELKSIRPPTLRRSTSEGSLFLHRALSKASSLGDDTRWIGVHKQVNSRMKALKDSWQDSNLKFPRLPDIPHLPDFARLPDLGTLSLAGSLLDLQSSRKRSSTVSSATKVNSPETSTLRARDAEHPSLNSLSAPSQSSTNVKSPDTSYPYFTRALKNLTGDVVLLGGYRGSVLRSAQPPHRQCWVPIKVGLNLRKVNLEVGLQSEDDENAENSIIADGMLKNIGPVDISRRLFKRLRASPNALNGSLRIWDFGYDWRLNPHVLSKKLLEYLKQLPCNSPDTPSSERGATIISHSLGGLITRHAINKMPELCRGVVYAGTPQTCVNILGPLRNGDDVLLSSRVLTAQVNFTMRTSFALLPLDGKCFFNRDTGEEFKVDFFDAHTWENHCLSPCIARPISISSLPTSDPGNSQTLSIPNIRGSMANVFSSVSTLSPRGRNSFSRRKNSSTVAQDNEGPTSIVEGSAHNPPMSFENDQGPHPRTLQPQMNTPQHDVPNGYSTAVTISKVDAHRYLERVLLEIKTFKEELSPIPNLLQARRYPPASVIYGKSIPTVFGAHVKSPSDIRYTTAYDELAFASGDGVVLAKAAMLPEGYDVARGGVVSSNRGHITLLGDLEAVGQALCAILADRKKRANSSVAH